VKYSSILTYHTNPFTCGVARFNSSLAKALGIPMVSFLDASQFDLATPLISVKFSEMKPGDADFLGRITVRSEYDLLLHDFSTNRTELEILKNANRVFGANSEISEQLRKYRPDVESLFAPGLQPYPPEIRADVELLTLGMAHKIQSRLFARLGELAAADLRSIRLTISAAFHEGMDFGESMFRVHSEVRHASGLDCVFAGFLSDEELSQRLLKSDGMVAFFATGVRENNTSVLGAMAHGCAVFANVDSYSPAWMIHGETIFDIERLESLPSRDQMRALGGRAKAVVREFSFAALVDRISRHR
jgi:hypothetical protein